MKKLKSFLIQASSKLLFLYFFATLFFLLGHFFYQGWDFSVYALDAQYLFGDGNYFEISRPPLMSFFLGIFSFLGWKAAEYVYIFFVSTLFFYSSLRFAKSVKLNPFYFYLFSLNAFVILFGLQEGTELLALALLEISLAFILEDKSYAGFFLGLVCLTRYPFVVFFPLVLFHKGWKTRLLSSLGFVVAFLPWFLYNKIQYGNIFYSIADSYALNVLYRDYVPHTFNWGSFFLAGNILLPFVILGLFLCFYRKKLSREMLLIFTTFFLILYSIYGMKADVVRYYIPLTLPFAFFSVYGFTLFSEKKNRILTLLFLFITLFFVCGWWFSHSSSETFVHLPEEIASIDDCALQSNIWVPLNYYGRVSEPNPASYGVSSSLEKGYYILLYYDAREPEYMHNQSFLLEYPIAKQTEKYILLGEGCLPIQTVNRSYLERLNGYLLETYNYTVSEDPCEILFYGNKICTFVNDIVAIP